MRVVFHDISKAFDRVRHKGFKKLEAAGIAGNRLIWFCSYLTSTWKFIRAGVFLRVLFLVLFFLLFINDIVTVMRPIFVFLLMIPACL